MATSTEVEESCYTKMVKLRGLELNHEYDTKNKVYQILSRTFSGSLMLIGYVRDKETDHFEKIIDNDCDDDSGNGELQAPIHNGKPIHRIRKLFKMRKVASQIMDHEFLISRERYERTKFLELRDACHALFPDVNQEGWYHDIHVVDNIPIIAKGALFREYTWYRNSGIAVGLVDE